MGKKLVEIEVTIPPGARGVKIDAKGFTGGACLSETKDLEEALGMVSDRKMKPESYQKSTTQEHQKLGK